ncbi:MAG: NAD-dependent epimerase/dehydratase family protein [Burkholderiaceae bacterium]
MTDPVDTADSSSHWAATLVTGSSGCIGAAVARRLASQGRAVVGLDLVAPAEPPPFAAVVGSLCDVHLIHRIFTQHRIERVVHCGGISSAAIAPTEPYLHCETNVFGTVHMLEASRIHGVKRFVYCSSTGAYGETGGVAVDETALLQPVSVYGATKAACDALLRAYRLQHGLDGISLRIGRVYGPGRRTASVVRDLLEAGLSGRTFRVPSDGGRRFQYVYVDDVVGAIIRALDLPQLPRIVYNLSGPGHYSNREVAALVRGLLPEAGFEFEPEAQQPTSGPLLDYEAAVRDLGYRPHTLEAGVASFLLRMRADVKQN